MSKILEKNDNLIWLEVLNQDFAEELKLILKLVSRIKDNSPHFKSYERKKNLLFQIIDSDSLIESKKKILVSTLGNYRLCQK
jgi:hypothetical protein